MPRDLPKTPLEPAFLTTTDVATVLRLTRQTVHRLLMTGELPSIKLGGSRLIPKHVIDDLLQKAA